MDGVWCQIKLVNVLKGGMVLLVRSQSCHAQATAILLMARVTLFLVCASAVCPMGASIVDFQNFPAQVAVVDMEYAAQTPATVYVRQRGRVLIVLLRIYRAQVGAVTMVLAIQNLGNVFVILDGRDLIVRNHFYHAHIVAVVMAHAILR